MGNSKSVYKTSKKIRQKQKKKLKKKLTSIEDEFYAKFQDRFEPTPQEGHTINEMDQEN